MKVLFVLAGQVFLVLLAISNDATNIKHPQFSRDAIKIRFFIPHYDYAGQWLFQICICGMVLCFSKDCNYVFDINHEQAIIAFEIDWYGAFGIEQHFVILTQRYVL